MKKNSLIFLIIVLGTFAILGYVFSDKLVAVKKSQLVNNINKKKMHTEKILIRSNLNKEKSLIANMESVKQLKTNILTSIKKNNIESFDSLFSSFLKIDQIAKTEKKIFLWNIAKTAKTDFVFEYTIDALSNLSPIELTPDVIELYKSVSKRRKLKLLNLLGDSLLLDSIDNIPEDQLKALGELYTQGKIFLKDEIYQATDQELFDALFRSYSQVASPKEVMEDISQLFNSSRDTKISNERLTNTILTLTLEDTDLQNDMLAQMMSDHNDDDFNETLSVIVAEFDNNEITPSARTIINDRINNNMRSITEHDLESIDKQNALVSDLKALSKIGFTDRGITKEELEVDLAISRFVQFELRPVALAASVVLSDDKTLKVYRQRKDEVYPALENRLNLGNLTDEVKEILNEAIRILK